MINKIEEGDKIEMLKQYYIEAVHTGGNKIKYLINQKHYSLKTLTILYQNLKYAKWMED